MADPELDEVFGFPQDLLSRSETKAKILTEVILRLEAQIQQSTSLSGAYYWCSGVLQLHTFLPTILYIFCCRGMFAINSCRFTVARQPLSDNLIYVSRSKAVDSTLHHGWDI